MSHFLQGIATKFRTIIQNNGQLFWFESGCFEKSINRGGIPLLIDHDTKSTIGSQSDRLEIYAGDDCLCFRLEIPDSWNDEFKQVADDLDTYFGVSIGLERTKTESIRVDGYEILKVLEADLKEISILGGEPAVPTTYARIVSDESCDTLEADYKAGRFDLLGSYISLHRKITANQTGKTITAKHVTSPYDRAASRFEKAVGSYGRMTLALAGHAVVFNKPIAFDGTTVVVLPEAFDETLRSGAKVRLLENHDDEQCYGSTDDDLELFNDGHGIAFRFPLRDNKAGNHFACGLRLIDTAR